MAAADKNEGMAYKNLIAGGLLLLAVVVLAGLDAPFAERLASVSVSTASTSSSTSLTVTTTTIPLGRMCGDPVPDRVVTATDALFALNAAVGLEVCELCLCDSDGSGSIAATDASILLQVAVGQGIELACPDC
jgi:hypothetical protein